MAELWDNLSQEVASVFSAVWTTRPTMEAPDPEDLKLNSNDGVLLDAVILYADLDGSTNLVDTKKPEFAAEIYKTYLLCAGKIIRDMGGKIVAYDGDRVMAVYTGDAKNSQAAQTALRINGAVKEIINPAIVRQYPKDNYVVKQVVGIDCSSILAVRTGVRGDNDIVWVGRAANYAAKICSLGSSGCPSIITADVYNKLNEKAKLDSKSGENKWQLLSPTMNGLALYGSTWYTYNF